MSNVSLLGMRCDDEWILTSIFIDDSAIREKVSSDLWSKINEDITSYEYTELRLEYVEVFMNNEYLGLYLLKEPIDEKNLRLNTSIDNPGVLIKGIANGKIFKEDDDIDNISGTLYNNILELKYPKMQDNKKYWSVILKKYKNFYISNFYNDVLQNDFYIDNIINYMIFLKIIGAVDNCDQKNTYFSIKDLSEDNKAIVSPWDLDLTFGLDFDSKNQNYAEIYENVDKYYKIPNLDNVEYSDYRKNVVKRWNILKENVLSCEEINNMIDKEYSKITIAGAYERENNKWKNADLDEKISNIKKWYIQRYDVISQYITLIENEVANE